ncbi:Fatty acid desaturase [Filomicrobium insigne]|uniref:Fatty acid desaturase n=1 Tax=Filomicrobium insigne TaxID=418854 RepID=A0A1H0LES3_9HYPH|nr:fatty acid desaturase [Filomicrobium insigne]SDO66605.1 Fatty acid desaturase [Filomicrobium insigne]
MGSQSTAVQNGIDADVDMDTKRDYRAVIRSLKERDNYTNFAYIAQVWAIIIGTIVLTVWSFSVVAWEGLGWWWNIPMVVVAVFVIGASQHQLGGIVHEGTHFILFENRKLNELASDWFGAFPIYTSTYAFRLHHLAHHQFVNDPERDPNFSQAKDSGHWLDFPVAHIDLVWGIIRQLNPVLLVSYIAARARYSALGVDTNPYADPKSPGSPWAIRWGVLYAVMVPFAVIALSSAGELGYADSASMTAWAMGIIVVATAVLVVYYAVIPDDAFAKSRLDPIISHRATAISRLSFMAILYSGLTLGEYYSGGMPMWGYFGLFWILPLFSTFPLFMILREWVQHGNADRGRYTNSRIFLVNPFVRYAVFPFGMDYHLPHHLMAAVPHYKLKGLHELLLEKDAQYSSRAQVVEGWSLHKGTQDNPTIVDVLGPDFAPSGNTAYVDDATLEYASVNDKDAIAAQKQESLNNH